jgi:hypothetical protein
VFCTLTTGPGPFGGTLQYCAESPTGAIESVRAPRANWCPGRVTPPFVVDGDLGTGDRFLQLGVAPQIAPGGSWFVSATAIFYADSDDVDGVDAP